MIREKKKQLIISSLLILLPILVGLLLWKKLPEMLTTHWGLDGQPDGWSSLPFAVFFPPILMLITQWICIWFTARDTGNQGRNKKISSLVLWIIPVISNIVSYMTYALALGMEFSPISPTIVVMGVLFAVIGNYMPKTRMNSTIGIKIYWTYTSEENWNATHRFAGKLWVIGGICMVFASLMPAKLAVAVMIAAIVVLAAIPMVYSYLYYRRQLARGDVLDLTRAASVKKAGKHSIVFIVMILAAVAVVMFTGNITLGYGEESFTIEASWYSDLTVDYDVIDSVEYREGNVDGIRVGGFGSGRLLMGYFENDEFGIYTRYTYYKPEACVVIYTDRQVLVVSGKTAEENQIIYRELTARIEK